MQANQPTRHADRSPDRADEAHTDDARQAIESGEPRIAGHTQGHVAADRTNDVEGARRPPRAEDDDREDWESGRQDAL